MRISMALACLATGLTTSLHAQTIKVLGHNNETIPAARITLTPVGSNAVNELVADGNGVASMDALPSYPYIIRIAALGYVTTTDTLRTAADKTYHLSGQPQLMNEVVITGQYAPSTIDNAVQKVQVIDRKKIDAMGAQNLRDVLSNQLNVRLSQDAILGSSMSLQGLSGQGVKILIDGVPAIGRRDGNIDLSQMNLQNVERIEIIEGPMAVSYGTDALAGTINLITKKTQNKELNAALTTYYETMGTYNVNGKVGLHKKKHTMMVNGGRNFFSGWDPGAAPSFFDMSAQLADQRRYQQWKPREQYMGGLQYTYSTGKTTYNYTGNYFQELIINRGYPIAPYGENTFDGYYRARRTDNAVFVKSELKGHKFINAFVSYNTFINTSNSYYVDLTTLDKILSNSSGGQDTNKFDQIASRGTFGTSDADKKVNYEAGYDINVQHGSGTLMEDGSKQMGDYAVFGSAEYKPVNDLTIRPGLRYSYNTNYPAPLIPSINTLYKLSEHVRLRASYARGFRAPSLKELYFYFVDVNHNIKGNADLKAENSDNYSLLATYTNTVNKTSYKIEGGLFYNDIRNLITLAMTGVGTEYTYVNIGKYKTNGAQINTQLNFDHFSISLGGSYTGTYNELSEAGKAPAFSYSPEVRSSVYYDLPKINFRASVFYKYTGRSVGYMTDADNNAQQTYINAYSIADASVSKAIFKKHITVAVGCKNLLNVQNVTANTTGTAHSSGASSISMGTGRYFFVKLDFNLNSNK